VGRRPNAGRYLLAPHLTDENPRTVLESTRHKSKRAVEELVATLKPEPDVPTVVRRLPAASHSAPPAAARASVMETQPPGPLAPPAHARACTSAQRRASDPPRADPHSTTHGLFDMWCSRWNYAPALMPAACALREIVLGLSRHPARCGLFGSALVLVAVANGRLDLLFSLFVILGTMAFADVWPFAHCCGERQVAAVADDRLRR
jgi:hypothetical protein